MTDHAALETVRLDVWLWRARFIKSRSEASRLVQKGKVRVTRAGETRRVTKPATSIMTGDSLAFVRANQLIHVRMLFAGERRGPACEARELYLALTEAE